MLRLWLVAAAAVELHSNRVEVLAPDDAHSRGYKTLAAEALPEPAAEPPLRHFLVRPSQRTVDLLKWGAICLGAALLANYALTSYRYRILRQEALTVRFLRPEVPRQPRANLTALERLAQETQALVRVGSDSFTVLSSHDNADVFVGKLGKPRGDRRQGCLLGQCVSAIFRGVGALVRAATSCVWCPRREERRLPAAKWLVGMGRESDLTPVFHFKHCSARGDEIVVVDLASTLRAPVGSIEIDECNWTARLVPRLVGKPTLTIVGSHSAGREAFLRVLRDGRTVALLTRGVTFKGFAPGFPDLRSDDTYVDFGEVVDDTEKLLLLAAAVFMDT